jgi:cysteinylglycine-S-conjugate dipeptidase
MTPYDVDAVAAHASEHFNSTVERLTEYLRYPAISCDEAHFGDVQRLADRIASDLRGMGLESVQVLSLPSRPEALPLVVAEHRSAPPGAPTVLIYGHLDLQPVRGEKWTTAPHVATRKGDRLYARGAADDMGGWISHLAAVSAYLKVHGSLPVNLKMVIEGEEEIGSPNLLAYVDAFPEAFDADVMVLTDCENPSTDIPGLTVSLRGLYEVEIACVALKSDVHSGLWGNMAPDPSLALVQLIARLVDEDGRMRLGRVAVDPEWQRAARDVPITTEVVRQGAHLAPGVDPLPDRGRPIAEWLWRQPAVTILSTTLPRSDEHKNAVRARASAWLSIRLAPGQTREEMRTLLEQALLDSPPAGVSVTLTDGSGGAESWLYHPKGPAFAAADRAYAKAWGRELLPIGVGGSIPFVALFGRRYADLPLILNGVIDPETGAHGPDESLHLGVFQKTILANVYLLDELARALGNR